MNAKQLIAIDEPEIVAHLKDFDPNDVVLDNYFYSVDKNIFKDFNYSDKEIALILNLTDTEYAELVKRYLNDSNNEKSNDTDEINQIKQKIEELENRLTQSREYEDASKKITTLEADLKKLNADLSIFDEFNRRYEEAEREHLEYAHLGKFNLNKIHEDLIKIDEDIQSLEQKILESKNIHREYNMTKTEYDKGKIGLAVFWSIAVIFIGVALYILQMPLFITIVAVLAGILISLVIVFTARMEVEYPSESPENEIDIEVVQHEIGGMKTRRQQILNLIGVQSTEEFFQMKAQHHSYSKKFNYLKEQKDAMLNGREDYKTLKETKESIEKEIGVLKETLANPELLLQPDEYLNVRRDVDNLKLRLNQNQLNQGLGKQDVKKKLEDIRHELSSKIPDYINILQQTLRNSFDSISTYFQDICTKLAITQQNISVDGVNYNDLSRFHKALIQFILVREIYKENFVFVIQYISSWSPEEIEFLNKFVESIHTDEAKFYIVDNKLIT